MLKKKTKVETLVGCISEVVEQEVDNISKLIITHVLKDGKYKFVATIEGMDYPYQKDVETIDGSLAHIIRQTETEILEVSSLEFIPTMFRFEILFDEMGISSVASSLICQINGDQRRLDRESNTTTAEVNRQRLSSIFETVENFVNEEITIESIEIESTGISISNVTFTSIERYADESDLRNKTLLSKEETFRQINIGMKANRSYDQYNKQKRTFSENTSKIFHKIEVHADSSEIKYEISDILFKIKIRDRGYFIQSRKDLIHLNYFFDKYRLYSDNKKAVKVKRIEFLLNGDNSKNSYNLSIHLKKCDVDRSMENYDLKMTEVVNDIMYQTTKEYVSSKIIDKVLLQTICTFDYSRTDSTSPTDLSTRFNLYNMNNDIELHHLFLSVLKYGNPQNAFIEKRLNGNRFEMKVSILAKKEICPADSVLEYAQNSTLLNTTSRIWCESYIASSFLDFEYANEVKCKSKYMQFSVPNALTDLD